MDGSDFHQEGAKPKRAPSWAAKLRRHSSLHSPLTSPIKGEAHRCRRSKFDRSQVTSCYNVDAMIDAGYSYRHDPPPVPTIAIPSRPTPPPQLRTYCPLLPEPSPSITPESRRTSGSDGVDLFTPVEISKGLRYDNIWRTLPPSGHFLAPEDPRPMPRMAVAPNIRLSRSADPMSPQLSNEERFESKKAHYSDCDQYNTELDSPFGDLIIHRSKSVGEDSAYDELNVEDAQILDAEAIVNEHDALLRTYGAKPTGGHEDMLATDYYNTLAQQYRDIANSARHVWEDAPDDDASISDIRFVPKPLFFANDYRGFEEVGPPQQVSASSNMYHPEQNLGDLEQTVDTPQERSRISRLSRSLSHRLSVHHRKTPSGQSKDEVPKPNNTSNGVPSECFRYRNDHGRQDAMSTAQLPYNDHGRGPSLQSRTTNSGFASSVKDTLKRISPTLSITTSTTQPRQHQRQPSSTHRTPFLRQEFADVELPASRWTLGAVQKTRASSYQISVDKAVRTSMPAPKSKGLALPGFSGLIGLREEMKRKQRREDIKNSIRVVGQADPYADVEFSAPKPPPPAGWI